MRARILMPALIVAAGLSTAAFGQGTPRVVVGDNPSLSGAPLYLALEKGYYREAGIDVQLEMSGTSSDMAVLLATNRLQVIGGALSAGFFNSLGKGLPIGLLMARATSPYFHYLMIRPDLKAKLREPSDLKGRTVAVARGAILVYELAKILEAGGLSLGDIELKYIPFGQMATALTTGAVDAALMISPLQDQVEAKGIGIKWINADSKIKAQPVLVSVWQMNTDWMRQNEDAARKFVRATLRGVRDYCNAYHRGPNRDEITRILADVKDPALINQIEWGATDVHGRIFEASLSDIQDTFLKEKLVADRVPIGRIAPVGWVGEVASQLGPFQLVRDDGAPGCR
ncbi:MAG TPA: ABC transporter substrate-binding protein [Xanthobacteraceae bacterium]|nr:ABC transporter substrate-binding protein [Xanthobacteraceae bacterium]